MTSPTRNQAPRFIDEPLPLERGSWPTMAAPLSGPVLLCCLSTGCPVETFTGTSSQDEYCPCCHGLGDLIDDA